MSGVPETTPIRLTQDERAELQSLVRSTEDRCGNGRDRAAGGGLH
jgi:hypothetical protein